MKPKRIRHNTRHHSFPQNQDAADADHRPMNGKSSGPGQDKKLTRTPRQATPTQPANARAKRES